MSTEVRERLDGVALPGRGGIIRAQACRINITMNLRAKPIRMKVQNPIANHAYNGHKNVTNMHRLDRSNEACEGIIMSCMFCARER